MCRKFMLGLLLALVLIAAAGCGGAADNAQENNTNADSRQEVNSTDAESETVTIPEERPALIVKVKEIVGNELTGYVAQAPQNEGTPQEAPVVPTQENRDDGGIRPGGARFGMQFAEETETFLIPVGVPIVTVQSAGKAEPVGLTAIKKDTVLQIWKENGVISLVQVAGGDRPRNAGQDGENNRQGTGGGMPPDMGGGPPPGMGGRM